MNETNFIWFLFNQLVVCDGLSLFPARYYDLNPLDYFLDHNVKYQVCRSPDINTVWYMHIAIEIQNFEAVKDISKEKWNKNLGRGEFV